MSNSNKARKYNSPLLSSILAEVTPLEKEQTKNRMLLAARIEDLVRERGWNNTQFADKAKKHPSEITKWLSGTQNFTTDILTEIAIALNVNLVCLFEKQKLPIVYSRNISILIDKGQHMVHTAEPFNELYLKFTNLKNWKIPEQNFTHFYTYNNCQQ